MAAAGTNVSNFAGLNITQKFQVTQAAVAAANTVAHGMTVTPDVFFVIPLDGAAVISAISVTATDVLFTSTTTGAVTIICF